MMDYKPKFGEWVQATSIFKRSHRGSEEKIWITRERDVSGIFVGYRTLANGRVDWEREFIPESYFRAALICPGPWRNIVRVPEDSLKAPDVEKIYIKHTPESIVRLVERAKTEEEIVNIAIIINDQFNGYAMDLLKELCRVKFLDILRTSKL
jgi:hypothetical protein